MTKPPIGLARRSEAAEEIMSRPP